MKKKEVLVIVLEVLGTLAIISLLMIILLQVTSNPSMLLGVR
nr:MAG TPA: hypothetical protein [Caudoviricetes sp.]